jgi:acyl-[acyl carrier protein]--UDP-N-acetylglucosamine O-acyltransferase
LYPDAAVSSYKGRGGVYLLYMSANETLIHPTALVDPGARIGKNVRIGPLTIIHRNVELGDNTVVGSHCELGHPSHDPAYSGPLVIGANSLIRSYSMFYEGSTFGEGLITGVRATVRENTQAGKGLVVGTSTEIQGHCEIGDYVRTNSHVFIASKSILHDFVWLFPHAALLNDPHPPSNFLIGAEIGRYSVIAGMSVVLPGIKDAGVVVAGSPAKKIAHISEIKLKDGTGRPAYPWRYQFHRGYPEDVVRAWIQEAEQLAASQG